MSIDINIQELEKMAKLNLSDDERSEIKKYMEFLVDRGFIRGDEAFSIGIIGGEEIRPLIHGIELKNVLREDKAEKKFDRETLLKSAPEHADGYFKVPKTI